MRIVIKSKNLEVNDSLRLYIEKRVGKLDRFLPDIHEALVDLAVQNAKSAKDRHVAQITLRSSHGVVLRAEERSGDIQGSLDTALDRMSRQIKRYKGKHWQSRSRPQAEIEELVEEEAEAEDHVVRIKRFEIRPMTVEEAIEQMELLGHDFFLFFNVSSDGFSVVYRRRDGGYGLLLPELA